MGDSHYGGKPLVAELKARGVRVVSNTAKDPSAADRDLLRKRSLVESAFAALKGKHKMVTSYCRSKVGYAFIICGFYLDTRWARSWPELVNSRLALYTLTPQSTKIRSDSLA